MHKLFSLIKATMTEDMNIFKINTKKKSPFTKILLPIFLTIIIMSVMYSYSEILIKNLIPVKMEFVLLTLFILLTSIMTIIEGIYKSGNLLFNCKDDNLLLSFPIKRSTVLFIRIFKFYVFELMYNSLFLIPSLLVYAKYTNPNFTYYIVSLVSLLLFPIIPILISCLIGFFITYFSAKFKGKNYVQTVITMLFLIGIMYVSYNSEGLLLNIAKNASNINDFITKIYYPAGRFVNLITNYNFIMLLEFIIVNLSLFVIAIFIMGKLYFNVNSVSKAVKINKVNKNYKIATSNPIQSLIKKEFNRFINSTVFVTNAGFGLVLYIIGCVLLVIRFDMIVDILIKNNSSISPDFLYNNIPVIVFGLICFGSLMTSITSSMISLEGKSFNILKSLPIEPYTIIKSKVLTAILIMIPCLMIGNIIIFIKFQNILEWMQKMIQK